MVVGTGSAAFGFSAGIDFGSIHAALGSSAGIDVGSGRAAFCFSIGTDVGSGKLLVPRCDWRSGVGASVGGGGVCFAGRAWGPSLSTWGGARCEGGAGTGFGAGAGTGAGSVDVGGGGGIGGEAIICTMGAGLDCRIGFASGPSSSAGGRARSPSVGGVKAGDDSILLLPRTRSSSYSDVLPGT